MKQTIKPIRHGEVILKPVAKVPEGDDAATNVTPLDSYRVADSDAGHHHVLHSAKMRVTTVGDRTFIGVTQPGELVHEKQTDRHKDLPVAIGIYEVLHKTEYDPFDKVMREVMD